MRRLLDGVYGAGLVGACLCMLAIAGLVAVQVGGRILDRGLIWAGGAPLGLQVPSLAEIGGFLFVAAAFLALPSTLRAGGHVRVTLLARLVAGPIARGLSALVLGAALGLAVFATWHLGAQALDSFQFNSLSFGRVRVPLWIPQAVMTAGMGLMALALADELVTVLRGGLPAYRLAEAERGTAEGGE
jgi:TRAP-type C4-dicarboxylate transport system permease small subunit